MYIYIIIKLIKFIHIIYIFRQVLIFYFMYALFELKFNLYVYNLIDQFIFTS